MPLVGQLCSVFYSIAVFLIFPRFSSSGLFEKQEFKRKWKHFVRYELLWYMVSMVKPFLGFIFRQLKHTGAQCVIAVLISIAESCTVLAFSKVMKKMVGTDNEKADVLVTVAISITYGLFSAIVLIDATITTTVATVVVEFLIQLRMTYQIVKLQRQVVVLEDEQARMAKQKAILKLVLSELMEGLIPVAYAIGFAMAYYGPNGYLLGNVKGGEWHFKAVDDESSTFTIMFLMFAIDLDLVQN